jgi:hypothetical protein
MLKRPGALIRSVRFLDDLTLETTDLTNKTALWDTSAGKLK